MRKRFDDDDAGEWKVVDLDTGAELLFVVWADDGAGVYHQYRSERDPLTDEVHFPTDRQGQLYVERRHGRIRLMRCGAAPPVHPEIVFSVAIPCASEREST